MFISLILTVKCVTLPFYHTFQLILNLALSQYYNRMMHIENRIPVSIMIQKWIVIIKENR